MAAQHHRHVAAPSIQSGLGASGRAAQFVVGGYLIAYAVLLITGALLGQAHGYKRLFLAAAAFGVTSLADGLAPDVTTLIALRVLQGIAAALMLPQVLTGIQIHFSGERRFRAIGLYAMALSVGAVAGQILGGVLISADIAGAGWRPVFLINVPVCVTVLACGWRALPDDSHHADSRLDLPGIALLSAAVLCVVVPLTAGPGTGWPAWTWATLAAGIPAFALFLIAERRALAAGRAPLIDTVMLTRPALGWGLAGLAGTSATYFALLFALAQYLQTGLHRGALFSGLILLPWVAAFGLAGQTRRFLPARLLPSLPVAGVLLLAAVYLIISASALTGTMSTPLLAAVFIPGGFALGTVFTALLGTWPAPLPGSTHPISAASALPPHSSAPRSASPPSAPFTWPSRPTTAPATRSESPPSPSRPPRWRPSQPISHTRSATAPAAGSDRATRCAMEPVDESVEAGFALCSASPRRVLPLTGDHRLHIGRSARRRAPDLGRLDARDLE